MFLLNSIDRIIKVGVNLALIDGVLESVADHAVVIISRANATLVAAATLGTHGSILLHCHDFRDHSTQAFVILKHD